MKNEDQPNYEKLRIWQASMELVESIYKTTKDFPREEQFGLTSQLRRAAISVPANIAEGHGKTSRADFRRFLSISKGSLQEINTLLQIALRLHFISEHEYNKLRQDTLSLVRQVSSLMTKIGEAI
ncbi:MAG: four helix bundle protein [bacterium]|nr:four helix bundle protein [bacterium]